MRSIVNSTFVSLDGVINHMGGWHFDFVDDELKSVALEQISECDALLMGRHTYESYVGVWPGRDDEMAKRLKAMPKHVVTTLRAIRSGTTATSSTDHTWLTRSGSSRPPPAAQS